jgi:hypothetical protein
MMAAASLSDLRWMDKKIKGIEESIETISSIAIKSAGEQS